MKNVQNSESSGTNEECAESRVPLKMKTYGDEAECATPHKKIGDKPRLICLKPYRRKPRGKSFS